MADDGNSAASSIRRSLRERASDKLATLDKTDYVLILLGLMFLVLIINLVLTIVFRHRDCNLEQPVINIFNDSANSP